MRERTDDDLTDLGAEQLAPPRAPFEPGFEPVSDTAPLAPAGPADPSDYIEENEERLSIAPQDVEPADHQDEEADPSPQEWPEFDDEPPARQVSHSSSLRLAEIFVINPAARRSTTNATFDQLDQLAKDIAEITQARETLLADRRLARRQAALPASRPFRTADSVPIILGSVIGFLMMTVIGIAALFTNFAR
jgi:hypothetical protein